jgi:hypothetical protein
MSRGFLKKVGTDLVIHSKMPKWKDIPVAEFSVIFHHKAIFDFGELFFPLALAFDFEGLSINKKIRDFGREDFLVDLHLRQEKRLPKVAYVWLVFRQGVN